MLETENKIYEHPSKPGLWLQTDLERAFNDFTIDDVEGDTINIVNEYIVKYFSDPMPIPILITMYRNTQALLSWITGYMPVDDIVKLDPEDITYQFEVNGKPMRHTYAVKVGKNPDTSYGLATTLNGALMVGFLQVIREIHSDMCKNDRKLASLN